MGQNTKPEKAKADRSLVEGGEDYPVRELAVATGISVDEAEALAEKHGEASDKAAKAARDMQEDAREENEAQR
jgi:hypothetical protein